MNSTYSATIQIPFPSDHYEAELDGRLVLQISETAETEPRFQLRDDAKTCQGFGMDLEGWTMDEIIKFHTEAFGYPIPKLSGLPSGEYVVQVVFHKYETFNPKSPIESSITALNCCKNSL